MPASSTISVKGQVTVPLEIRRRLGLKPGDRVEFVVESDRTILRPARKEGNPFEKYVGALPEFKDKKQINDWVADLRDNDQG
jgi:AbrB family looped-hinge helix DNA binding protein